MATLAVIAIAGLAVLPADAWRKIGAPWLADWHWLLASSRWRSDDGCTKRPPPPSGASCVTPWLTPPNICRPASGPRARPQAHEFAARGGPLQAHHHGLTQPRHHARPRSSELFLGATRGGAKNCRVLAGIRRALRTGRSRRGTRSAKSYAGGPRPVLCGATPPSRCPRRPAGAPCADPQTSPDSRWLITDFVTLGSPLAHAQFLIAASAEDLARRKFERELPQSPPLREDLDPKVFQLARATHKLPVGPSFETSKLISFPPPSSPQGMHHAAPFAVVRWTNIYDSASLVFRGDIIGGPVANAFGPAIIDIDLKCLRGQSRSFTHTKYWAIDGEPISHRSLAQRGQSARRAQRRRKLIPRSQQQRP